ncbi:MAG: hypothetical protein HYT49_01195 [Candidatus Wildermuthbacteria bacterium]|nr:hypothetical protein [Candidatus Wildermuthbacteria bacterium]
MQQRVSRFPTGLWIAIILVAMAATAFGTLFATGAWSMPSISLPERGVSEAALNRAAQTFAAKPANVQNTILANCFRKAGIPFEQWPVRGTITTNGDQYAWIACIYVDAGLYPNYAAARAAIRKLGY